MGCLSSKPLLPVPESPSMRPVTAPVLTPLQTAPVPPPAEVARARGQSRGRRGSTASTRSTNDLQESSRHRTTSAPQRVPSASSQNPRSARYQTVALPNTGIRTGSRAGPRLSTPVHTKARTRALVSTTHQVLSNHTKFRILILGKRDSGKSSLINTVFKVDTSAVKGSINQEVYQDDNRYLIVHEYSAFGPGEGQNLQTIRDFISNWTDQARLPTERLNAIWICIPASDAMSGSIGEGIEDVLNMKRVPTIVAFTKFDQVVALEGGSSVRTDARAWLEQSCRSLFRKEPKDVSAEVVSAKPQFSDLIDSLVVTTDRFMTGPRTPSGPSSRSSAQGAKPRIAPGPLVWSAALRVNRDIFIQASIEVGRSRYWRDLSSSLDFAGQPPKACVNVIHTDIVEIWNLNDKSRYLSSSEFKAKMSHVVKDLAGSAGSVSASPDFAEWVYDVYRGSQENVRCVMGYIVDLTVILDGTFRIAAGRVSRNDVQAAMDRHLSPKSGRRESIHRDINSVVEDTFKIRPTPPPKDMVLENIIRLVGEHCVPPSKEVIADSK